MVIRLLVSVIVLLVNVQIRLFYNPSLATRLEAISSKCRLQLTTQTQTIYAYSASDDIDQNIRNVYHSQFGKVYHRIKAAVVFVTVNNICASVISTLRSDCYPCV